MALGPLHCKQDRAAPFSTNSYSLDETEDGKNDCTPDSDLRIVRHKPYQHCCNPHEQQGRYEGRLTPHPVSVMTENRGTDRPSSETDGIYQKRLQRSDQRIGLGKKLFCKH